MKRNKAYIREIYAVFFLIIIICFTIFFLFPTLNKEIIGYSKEEGLKYKTAGTSEEGIIDAAGSQVRLIREGGDSYLILSDSSDGQAGLLSPKTGDYIILGILAQNNSAVDFPKGTAAIRWKYAGSGSGSDYGTLEIEKFQIFVDGISHDYHVNIGENPNWDTSGKISEIRIELPSVEGISIEIEELSLRERLAAPIDSLINRFFRNNFNIREINRFFIPAYLGFIMICFFIFSLKLVSKKVITGKVAFSFAAIILVIFSFYYIKNEIFTIKSYFASYRNHIAEGNFKNTYLGFYDFEKFIAWLDESTPDDENMIVLVRGEQIYIMSEMAYNLYPKDLKFINISGKSLDDIEDDIDMAVNDPEKKYSYLVSLSKDDFIDKDLSMPDESELKKDIANIEEMIENLQKKYVREKNYRETGGFLYRINNYN